METQFFGYAPVIEPAQKAELEPNFFGYGVGLVTKDIDVESDLRGFARPYSTCAENKYKANLKLMDNNN
jgi:hypothetical protein